MTALPDDMVLVEVSRLGRHEGTLRLAYGIDAETGEPVTFAGEPRYLDDIETALERGETPDALVPRWAIIRRFRADHTGHRGHWDNAGTGDWHCSEHREPGCACLPVEALP